MKRKNVDARNIILSFLDENSVSASGNKVNIEALLMLRNDQDIRRTVKAAYAKREDPNLKVDASKVSAGVSKLKKIVSAKPELASWVTNVCIVLARMTPKEALQTLGLTAEEANDKSKLKRVYRQAAQKSHPDRGGSTAEMQRVNDAYEALKDGVSLRDDSLEGWRARQQREQDKWKRVMKVALPKLRNAINLKEFEAYFEKQFNKSFNATIDQDHARGYTVKVESDDEKTIFESKISIDLDVRDIAMSLGDSDPVFDFDLRMSSSILHDNRKPTRGKNDYSVNSRASLKLKPTDIIPKGMIAKAKRGKSRKFSKRDMVSGLEKYAGASVMHQGGNVTAQIKLGGKILVQLTRFSSRGSDAIWQVGVFNNYATAGHANVGGMPEGDELLNAIVEFSKKAKNIDDPKAAIRAVEKHLKPLEIKF